MEAADAPVALLEGAARLMLLHHELESIGFDARLFSYSDIRVSCILLVHLPGGGKLEVLPESLSGRSKKEITAISSVVAGVLLLLGVKMKGKTQ